MNYQALFIAIPGTLSMIAILFTLFSIFLFNKNSLSLKIRYKLFEMNDNKNYWNNKCVNDLAFAVKDKRSIDWLIMFLLHIDLLQSLAAQQSYFWINNSPQDYPAYCFVQGYALTISDLYTAVWSLVICIMTYRKAFFGQNIGLAERAACIFFSFLFVFVMSTAVIAFNYDSYQDSGNESWCFIAPQYPGERVWMHYFWIVLCIFGLIIGNSYMYYKLSINPIFKDKTHSLFSKLIWYPIFFSLIFSPIAVNRILKYAGVYIDDIVTAICFSLVMFIGFLNSVTFLIRKDIVNKYYILFGYRPLGPDRVSVNSNTIFEPPVIVGIETKVIENDTEPQNLF